MLIAALTVRIPGALARTRASAVPASSRLTRDGETLPEPGGTRQVDQRPGAAGHPHGQVLARAGVRAAGVEGDLGRQPPAGRQLAQGVGARLQVGMPERPQVQRALARELEDRQLQRAGLQPGVAGRADEVVGAVEQPAGLAVGPGPHGGIVEGGLQVHWVVDAQRQQR